MNIKCKLLAMADGFKRCMADQHGIPE